MKKIVERLAEQADKLDKKGLKKEADRIDNVLKSIAVPTLNELFNVTPNDKPGMGRHTYEQMEAEEKKRNTPVSEQPQQETQEIEAPKPKTPAVPILQYTKPQLLEAIKQNPGQEEAIRSHLVPALNQYVGVSAFDAKSIVEIIDAAEKFGLLKKPQGSWYEKLF